MLFLAIMLVAVLAGLLILAIMFLALVYSLSCLDCEVRPEAINGLPTQCTVEIRQLGMDFQRLGWKVQDWLPNHQVRVWN